MSAEQFANNAKTTLAANLSNSATVATLASGTGALFPNPGAGQFFRATLYAAGSTTGTPNEIVYVTARTTDTVTLLRGQEGTAPAAWNAGDNFINQLTAGAAANWAQQTDVQAQVGNAAVDSGTQNAGVITLSPAPASLTALKFVPLRVQKAAGANGGAYTLNVNGFGPQPVTFQGNALLAGDLPNEAIFNVMYDGALFELQTMPGNGRGGPPTGPAGGVLALTYPNPGFANAPVDTILSNLTGSLTPPTFNTLSSVLSAFGFLVTLGGSWLLQVPNPAGGAIIAQGGWIAGEDDSEEIITLPSAFPTACDWVGGTLSATSLPAPGADGGCYGRIISRSQIAVGILVTNGPGYSTISGIYWWAIGH